MKDSLAVPHSQPAAPSARLKPRFQPRPLQIVAGVSALVIVGAGAAAVGAYSTWQNSAQIAPRVQIAGQPIGGLTKTEAVARLNERFGKVAVTLRAGDKDVALNINALGAQPSVEATVAKAYAIGRDGGALDNFVRVFQSEAKPRKFALPIRWNRGALTSRLKMLDKQYAIAARDAKLVAVSGAAPRVEGERVGRAIDISASADAIQKSYYLGLPRVEAITQQVEPRLRAADLAGRDVKLGSYRTSYNGGIAGRTTNIHVASRALDGQVLMPGEVMSFNQLTGERTYGKGYRMAHIFLREKGQSESQIVDGLAGGVCQVSSTLYNAVRKTNNASDGQPLKIVERSSHSLPVAYVPSGLDATVAWPYKDFKFRNAHPFPVYVRAQPGNSRLTISIWGRVPPGGALPVSLEN